jgi:hypothetical protein
MPSERRTGLAPPEWKSLCAEARSSGAGAPTANRITLLRNAIGDGIVDRRTIFLESRTRPLASCWSEAIFT